MAKRGEEPVLRSGAVPAMTPRRMWLLLLAAGLGVWLATAFITALTEDPILLPSVILVGSFLVPVTLVVFALSRTRENHLTLDVVLLGFLGGGTLGLLCAALTEVYLLPTAMGTFVGVGFIEELAKGLVLVAVARGVETRTPRDGMVLGATVGAGFAAFESSGYAFRALIENGADHAVINIVSTEAIRAVSAPFGHVMWTCLLGGALFASRRVLWTFVGVVALHAAWDASNGLSIILTQGVLGEGWNFDWPNTEDWIGVPTGQDLAFYNAISAAMLVAIALIGTVWVVSRWRRYDPVTWAMNPRTSAAGSE